MFERLKRVRRDAGYDEYSAETVDRLLNSQHVKDLRWIAQVCTYPALSAILVLLVIVLPLLVYDFIRGSGHTEFYKVVLPLGIATIVALGGVITWCYQTGSARLGVVDLVACEITTLCRIWTVNAVVPKRIQAYELDVNRKEPIDPVEIKKFRERYSSFKSEETYTPIFDGNSKDLRNLDVKVLINTTAFYTYWKATIDAYRILAAVSETTPGPQIREEVADPWHGAMRNLLYMQFLACESARKAIRDLIEFQPNNAENTITILLSELPAYGFLRDNFPPLKPGTTDVRHERLKLRLERYKEVVNKLYDHVRKQYEEIYQDDDTARRNFPHRDDHDREDLRRDWARAYGMLDELADQYYGAIRERIRNEKPRTQPPIFLS